MNLPSERNSPMSSSEALSGSTSPHVLKLNVIPAQQKKQRSLSMNSIGSNHSTQHRSMSIISLELPSNSIVLIDDNFLRPTRNNSTASLASLAPHVSPNDIVKDTVKDNYASHRMSKFRLKNASAVMSDEESESENVVLRFKWRRRSSDKVSKPTFLLSLKKDFKFKYDNHLVLKVALGLKLEDLTPSPLSLSTDAPQSAHLPVHYHDPDAEAVPTSSRAILGKKLRTSSITQLMFMKKRLLLSKDIQLELLGAHNATTSSSASLPHEDSKFPAILLPTPLRTLIHNYLQLQLHDPPSHSAPLPHVKSPSPIAISPPTISQPNSPPRDNSALRQQNKLISELNRKWNKAFFDEMKKPIDLRGQTELKKRMRSELVSSNDSYTASSR